MTGPSSIWPVPERGVEVTVVHTGALQYRFTITQPGSMIASIGYTLTRWGAHQAAAREVRRLRKRVQREGRPERYTL